MQVFSSLARRLDDDDFRQRLLNIDTAEQMTTYLAEQLGLPDASVTRQGD
jgi:mannitol/fructose-specific phosphotransferase system IIA component (Ntr-type)